MHWADILGYVAAACTLATYSMTTMIPLRISAIVANCLFLSYGFSEALYPTLVLHAILLPLNAQRLYQMLQLTKSVRAAATGDLSMDWLKPYMKKQAVAKGEPLIRKGEVADKIYYLASGRYRAVDLDMDLPLGQVIGELGPLSPGRLRTESVECVEDGEVLAISYGNVEQLYFQNPKFGFYFLRLATERLFKDRERLGQRLAQVGAGHVATPAATP